MARGGKRENAGRKVGMVTEAKRIAVERGLAALGDGPTPLEVMLELMHTAESRDEKLKAALGAAPYVHPRLAAVEHSGNAEKPMVMQVVSGVPRDADDVDEVINGSDAEPHASH